MPSTQEFKRWISMLRRASEADPSSGDLLSYVSNNQVQWIDPATVAADHGGLAGLGDDDHTSYHTDARAETWAQGLLVGCRVREADVQTITTSSATQLPFDNERYDPDGMHDTSTNNSRITISDAGRYLVGGHVQWEANATGQRLLQIYLNGTTVLAGCSQDANAVGTTQQSVATVWGAGATDYFELRVWQNSGGDLDILVPVAAAFSPELYAQMLIST